MLRFIRLVARLLRPLYLQYLLWRHGDIWRLKAHLQTTVPSLYAIAAYDSHFLRHGSWIGYRSKMMGIPCFPHGPIGVFISNDAEIGKNVIIFQQVTIGSNTLVGTGAPGSPRIGNDVYIGVGARIIGGIYVADNCRIGANAVVYKDMPVNTLAVQAPTRLITREAMDNRYFSENHRGERVYYNDGKWIVESNSDSAQADIS